MITAREAKENRAIYLTEKYSYIFERIEKASKYGSNCIYVRRHPNFDFDVTYFRNLGYEVNEWAIGGDIKISW